MELHNIYPWLSIKLTHLLHLYILFLEFDLKLKGLLKKNAIFTLKKILCNTYIL